jgi:hypothetical protein
MYRKSEPSLEVSNMFTWDWIVHAIVFETFTKTFDRYGLRRQKSAVSFYLSPTDLVALKW